MSKKLVCIVGMAGAGKSLIADELASRGFQFLRFGQITLDKIKEEGIEVNEENEKRIRERLRKEHGMAAFAILNIPKIDELLKKSDIAVDGLYSWSEYKVLKEKYGENMYVLAIYASPHLRYERISKRSVKNDKDQRFRSITAEDAKKRDFAEIENIEKGGPIVMADFTIVNTGTADEAKKQLDKILNLINKNNYV